jgi:hypothetical protein
MNAVRFGGSVDLLLEKIIEVGAVEMVHMHAEPVGVICGGFQFSPFAAGGVWLKCATVSFGIMS